MLSFIIIILLCLILSVFLFIYSPIQQKEHMEIQHSLMGIPQNKIIFCPVVQSNILDQVSPILATHQYTPKDHIPFVDYNNYLLLEKDNSTYSEIPIFISGHNNITHNGNKNIGGSENNRCNMNTLQQNK